MPKNLTVPISIIIAGALIAGALFFAGQAATPSENTRPEATEDALQNVPPVTDEDHVLGNPNAPIVIIEYSDIECPFCKQFHVTMQQIIDEYGRDGRVAWVYRHFPLTQLHPNAPRLAEASECVAEIGGNTAFWSFLDEVFIVAPGNTPFPMNRLNEVARTVGVDENAFTECLESGRYRARIEQQFNDALASGGQGTPFNIIIAGDEIIPIPGAQPYATIKQIIESLITVIPEA
jgi:protein-disulfide isomerase